MKTRGWIQLLGGAVLWFSTAAIAEDTIKLGFIDPLSGTFANIGERVVRHLTFVIEDINIRGGVLGKKLELVQFDSKANAQDALIALRQVTDQGIHFLIQGASSAVAGALSEAIAKHNSRSPEAAVVLLNYAAIDPALTNDRCNFWHFRFDADADMKMQALANTLKGQRQIHKFYLINQDYAAGQAFQRAAREMIPRARPDIQFVGDDLHPLGKIKDFSPYVAKIMASGADAVGTLNWGSDLALLVKAGKEAGIKVDYYTFWSNTAGVPAAIRESGEGHVKLITVWHQNVGDMQSEAIVRSYRRRFPDSEDDFITLPIYTAVQMLVKAMTQAASVDPLQVAKALEGMKYPGVTGEVTMRADNHQLLQPIYAATFTKAAKYDIERTGLGFVTDSRVEAKDTAMPTTCKMERP
jgi:branched-chain amino acid transport system substrate-binding protein